MNLRELLKTEIWSKRTTRKVLVGIGIVFGLAILGLGILFAVEKYWLTKGERNAARVALAQIEALQNCASCSDQEFDVRDKQVEGLVEIANQAALTDRDEGISAALLGYLSMIESEHREPQMRRMMQERHLSTQGSDPALEERMRLSEKQTLRLLHSVLHKALD